VIKSDITEQKNLEMRFLRAQRLESIGTLASGVAHDLNNILAPILMSVPLFREPLQPQKLQELVSVVETAAQRGAEIVKQVLTFGRGIQGERTPLQVRHLVRDVERIACETFPKNISFVNSIAKDTQLIEGDATQLHQVLLNLCVNARDAMPTGGTLRISAEDVYVDEYLAATLPEAKQGSYVQIVVNDTGTGIPAHVLEKIFDPFFTTKPVGTGTGLGLSTVLGIVKSHGGFINVYSEVERGTTFKVYLPAAASGTVLPVEIQESSIPRGNGEKILVVDDEPGLCKLSETTLRKYGYDVMLASDGTEALALYVQDPAGFALVLTDLMMPLMDGVTLVRVLRHVNSQVRIIASTGLGEDGRREELRALGVTALLIKPYNTACLLKTIHNVLQESVQPVSSN
jgi:nitrogen-specific signal transduction histidine kinase/CheY-like chemotaxis protein